MLVVKIILSLVILLLATSVFALRCGNELIAIGDTPAKVLQACGQPLSKSKTQLQNMSPQRGISAKKRKTNTILIWTYNFGSTDFLYTLSFQHGRLTHIETNGYGY